MLSLNALKQSLFRKSPADVQTILDEAEQVVFGATSSISSLSQSASYSIEDAGVIVTACLEVMAAREANPDASGNDLPGRQMGHSVRFQPGDGMPGYVWGA